MFHVNFVLVYSKKQKLFLLLQDPSVLVKPDLILSDREQFISTAIQSEDTLLTFSDSIEVLHVPTDELKAPLTPVALLVHTKREPLDKSALCGTLATMQANTFHVNYFITSQCTKLDCVNDFYSQGTICAYSELFVC